jgi:hypothetical protein
MNHDRYLRVARTMMTWAALPLSLSLALASCSTQGDGGTSPGDSVLTSHTSRVVAASLGGGFGPGVPATAPCHLEYSFDFALATGDLTWKICRVQGAYNDPASYSIDSGTRALTASERTQVVSAIQAVTISDGDTCGADLDSRQITVTSNGVTTIYGDDFYACSKQYGRYVTSQSLAQLLDMYRTLTAHPLPAN